MTIVPEGAKPILFKPQLVAAILEGRKSQTRRIMKPQPRLHVHSKGQRWQWESKGYAAAWVDNADPASLLVQARARPGGPVTCLSPHGAPGDLLWVRETWRYYGWTDDGEPWIEYKADGAKCVQTPTLDWQDRVQDVWADLSSGEATDDGRFADERWRPSIFLPKWACRLVLEVTEVRVERLQDIGEEDAKAEGVVPDPYDPEGDCWSDGKHRTAFNFLWNTVHGWDPNSWASNPWVFVYTFKIAKRADGR